MTAPKLAKTDTSFVILRLAYKITFPRQLAALLVLRFMAKCAKSNGRCFPGYALISAMCGGIADSTIAEALQYLYSLRILTLVKQGHGNQHGEYNASNVYKFIIKDMQRLVTHQGIYSPDDDNNKCLLHGKALTERVKLLTSLGLPSEPPADLSEQSAALPEQSADLSERSADLSEARLTSSIEQLSVNPTPSVKQLTEQRKNPPVQKIAPVGMGVQPLEGVSQFVPPLTSLRQVSRIPPITKANRYLPHGHRPEREVQYLEDVPC
jgi:hypothetical protein